jgi:hypothetical protein
MKNLPYKAGLVTALAACALTAFVALPFADNTTITVTTSSEVALIAGPKTSGGALTSKTAGSSSGRSYSKVTFVLNYHPLSSEAIVLPKDPMMAPTFYTVTDWNTPNAAGAWTVNPRREIPLAIHIVDPPEGYTDAYYDDAVAMMSDALVVSNALYQTQLFGAVATKVSIGRFTWPVEPESGYLPEDIAPPTDGYLHLYLAPNMGLSEGGGRTKGQVIVIGSEALPHLVAHEVGHAMALQHPLTAAELLHLPADNVMYDEALTRDDVSQGQAIIAHSSSSAYRPSGWTSATTSLPITSYLSIWRD